MLKNVIAVKQISIWIFRIMHFALILYSDHSCIKNANKLMDTKSHQGHMKSQLIYQWVIILGYDAVPVCSAVIESHGKLHLLHPAYKGKCM